MGIKNLFGLIALLGATGFSVACTRAPERQANVKLILPSSMLGKVGAANAVATPPPVGTMVPKHIVINVSGAGIAPIVKAWDSDDGKYPLPDNFEMTVPSGVELLVQVLALYEPFNEGGVKFYYGDAVAKKTDALVTVSVSGLGATASESQILGRWVDNATFAGDPTGIYGPTTKIIMKYTPPVAGDGTPRPRMIVHTSEMFGGLFSLFATNGPVGKFNYETAEGIPLFGASPVNTDDFNPGGGDDWYTKIAVPQHYREEHNDGGSVIYKSMPPSTTVAGWFGPPSASAFISGLKVCYPDTGADIRGAYVNADNSTPFQWDTSFVASGGYSGTVDSGVELCTASGDRYSDYLSLDGYNLSGREDALAVTGPYLQNLDMGYRSALFVDSGGADLYVSWEYAAGTVTQSQFAAFRRGVDGTDVFYRALLATYTGDRENYKVPGGDGVACGGLSKLGFKLLGSVPADESNLSSEIDLPTAPAEILTAYTSGGLQLLACPYQMGAGGKKYFSSAARFESYSNGGNGNMATDFQIQAFNGGTAYTVNNVCTPYRVIGLKNGYPAPLPPSTTIAAGVDVGGVVDTYSDPLCSDPWANVPAMPHNDGGYIIYVNRATAGIASGDLELDAPGMNLGAKTLYFQDIVNSNVSPGNQKLYSVLAPKVYAHSCSEAYLAKLDNSNGQLHDFDGTSYYFDWDAQPNVKYYNDPSCMEAENLSPSSYMLNGEILNNMPMYFKYTGSNSTLNLVASPGIGPAYGGSFYYSPSPVEQPGVATRFEIRAPMIQTVNSCYEVQVFLKDANGLDTVDMGKASPVAMSTAGLGGLFYGYSGANCSSGCSAGGQTARAVTINLGESGARMCFKPTVGTSQNMTATFGVLNGSAPINP